ncbi:M23 family metallopeptidase [Reyranella sp.]|uniref:M23 family metallopeptidase n=1 Tax=Reyranella sp. TaxID=1929291 RepID=UPI003BAABF67
MAFTTTQDHRAPRWRIVPSLLATTFALSALQFVCAAGSMAQVKAPSKHHLKSSSRAQPAPSAPVEDIRPFSIAADGSVAGQLSAMNIDPADAQSAADAVGKAMAQMDTKTASSGRAVLLAQGAGQPKRLVSLQIYSAKSLAVDLHRGADGSYGFKLAPNSTESEDERTSSMPGATAAPASAGARTIVAGSVSLVKGTTTTGLASTLASTGASSATLKELAQALSGFAPNAAKVDVWKGRTSDGAPRLLVASLGDGPSKQTFWWFAPPNQPEGWFDQHGRRLGGSALAEPRPHSRISSPFGTRRYYGRKSGGGFHNGIDFEGKTGDAIYAAADGMINHQGWYFQYGRTVKISHADNFETLYAHMSRFADGMGPGSRVRKGDLIGFVGSTGRSTGPHLHFSVIVNGQFVDPAKYISEKGGDSVLVGESLVSYRQWQQDVRRAAGGKDNTRQDQFRGLHGAEPWSHNPFASQSLDRL